ncbi:uncharacterized protein PFL1_06721 [Pseudozyma flocculosa PF-1]|uniref:Peptidase M20 dimerisation domain-containing protein n=2 Tax=Pseudozyma flocculosa TaxID=84751 RepID=A0A5C3F5F4_9BASI|nr:uncharacterized protein PFL1_06721 [Pseudozyma flocculosa PF-1]EPQ25727.1 hypothetical protein PFL1_06721 [Pseudozyma flocculosa PF-1]SPO38897.1 uncharacterized protein PSFLO_04376 [Pseudozyma flocculosa]
MTTTAPCRASLHDAAVELTRQLVRIDSTSPSLSRTGEAAGESGIAAFLVEWLTTRGFEIIPLEPSDPRRPSVLAVHRGRTHPPATATTTADAQAKELGLGRPRSILFNGHIDTVSVSNYATDPFSGELRDGRVYGRGAADMKAGLACALVAAASFVSHSTSCPLRGDVWIAAVADEEDASRGSYDILRYFEQQHDEDQAPPLRRLPIDGAVFPEPTDEQVITMHRGFVWATVCVHGRAAHGSLWEQGRDAVAEMGAFLCAFRAYAAALLDDPERRHPILGRPSAHAGTIRGGDEVSTYPSECTVVLERRTLPGEDDTTFRTELLGLLDSLPPHREGFSWSLDMGTVRPPLVEHAQRDFQDAVMEASSKATGRPAAKTGGQFWTDAALFSQAGVPSVVVGPHGQGIHAHDEWVEVESIKTMVDVYSELIQSFCA